MGTIHVRKQFDLRGRNDDELKHRVRAFGDAVRARGGVVLMMSCSLGRDANPVVSVVYQVPAHHAANDGPSPACGPRRHIECPPHAARRRAGPAAEEAT